MTAQQHGNIGRDNYQIQAGGLVVINPGDEPPESSEPPPNPMPWLAGMLVAVAVGLLILGAVFSSDGRSEESFPKRSDHWPAGSTNSAVLAPVLAKLNSCAREKVPKPETCPQQVSDAASEQVTWALDGDPADGARVTYHDGRFDVVGHAVMTVSYDSYIGQKFSVHRVAYRAKVTWNSGHPVLEGPLNSTNVKPNAPPVAKKANGQTWSQVQRSLQRAFEICVESREAPMPLYCPRDSQTDMPADRARWHLDSDPLLDTRSTFDASWGLIHVIGNYAVTVHTEGWWPRTERGGGTYDAVLAVRSNGWPQVLRIERKQ